MRHLIYKWTTLVVVLFLSVTIGQAQAERILNYDVIVEVEKDRSIRVKEEIKIIVAANKRGITRSLPRSRTMHSLSLIHI